MRICHKGSALGEKANAAMEACAAKVQTRAKKGKGKKPNKCPTVDDIMQWADEEYAEEVCMFTEVGWLDNKMNSNKELIEADIKTLPAPIAEALNGEEYETCYAMAMEKMANVAPECDSKYSDEEKQKLEELADAIAHTECFQYIFKKSCGSYAIKSLTEATNEKKEEKVMCLSDEATGKMMEICHRNSALGEKANAAKEVCSAKAEARAKAGKGKGKGKGKGIGKKPNKCPSIKDIMEWAEEEYADEVCMFTEVGWLD